MPQTDARYQAPHLSAAAFGLLIILALVWGASFFFVGVALKEVPPLTIVLVRVALAALTLIALLPLLGTRLPMDATSWLMFFAMGFLNNFMPFSLIAWGQTQIPSGLAAILNATAPLFAACIAHFATRDERLDALKIAGLLVGLLGVAILINPGAGALAAPLLAQLAVLLAALFYGISNVLSKRFKHLGITPLQAATGQLTSTTLMMFPVALIAETPWRLPMPSAHVVASLCALALVSTAFAYILFFKIVAAAGAINVSLVALLVPVSAMLLGTAVLGEHLSWNAYLGLLLIGGALLLVDGRLLRRRKA